MICSHLSQKGSSSSLSHRRAEKLERWHWTLYPTLQSILCPVWARVLCWQLEGVPHLSEAQLPYFLPTFLGTGVCFPQPSLCARGPLLLGGSQICSPAFIFTGRQLPHSQPASGELSQQWRFSRLRSWAMLWRLQGSAHLVCIVSLAAPASRELSDLHCLRSCFSSDSPAWLRLLCVRRWLAQPQRDLWAQPSLVLGKFLWGSF